MSENNLAELLLRWAESAPNRLALTIQRNGGTSQWTWAQLADAIHRLSFYLKAAGVQKGSRIALLSENRPEWVMVDLAAFSVGASIVPLYPQSSAQDVEYIVSHSESSLLFLSTPVQCEKINSARSRLKLIREVISFDDCGSLPQLKNILSEIKIGEKLEPFLHRLGEAAAPQDEASLIYTSGTTGKPKGVILTHRNILSNVKACSAVIPLDQKDHLLSFLPLSHVFERTVGYYFPLSQGCQVTYAESMATVPDDLIRVRPTVMCSAPRLYEKMYASIQDKLLVASPFKRFLFFSAIDVGRKKYVLERQGKKIPAPLRLLHSFFKLLIYQKIQKQFGGRLRFFISGGAPLAKDIAEFFYMANILIIEGYGLTETAPVLCANAIERFKFGTVGHPLPGVEIKIAEDGEILARGECIMKGYFNDPKATEEALQDGWFHTGDIGSFDGEGFLRITDRKKDIIVTAGGKNVSPQKIEKEIISDRFISQIVVIGDRMPYLTAMVVPSIDELKRYADYKKLAYSSKEDLFSLEEIRSLFARRLSAKIKDLSKFEQIQYIFLLQKEFTLEQGELTPTLKIRRGVIMKKYQNLVNQLYRDDSSRIPISASL